MEMHYLHLDVAMNLSKDIQTSADLSLEVKASVLIPLGHAVYFFNIILFLLMCFSEWMSAEGFTQSQEKS